MAGAVIFLLLGLVNQQTTSGNCNFSRYGSYNSSCYLLTIYSGPSKVGHVSNKIFFTAHVIEFSLAFPLLLFVHSIKLCQDHIQVPFPQCLANHISCQGMRENGCLRTCAFRYETTIVSGIASCNTRNHGMTIVPQYITLSFIIV